MFVWVGDFLFFLEARPPPLLPFFEDDSPDTLSLPPFSIFLIFFHTDRSSRALRLRLVG